MSTLLYKDRYIRYNNSEKGRARAWHYYNSPQGYAERREKDERDTLSGKKAKWHRERYHQIQDEAGCHYAPESFYPAYRFLKGIEAAQVVEIKL